MLKSAINTYRNLGQLLLKLKITITKLPLTGNVSPVVKSIKGGKYSDIIFYNPYSAKQKAIVVVPETRVYVVSNRRYEKYCYVFFFKILTRNVLKSKIFEDLNTKFIFTKYYRLYIII